MFVCYIETIVLFDETENWVKAWELTSGLADLVNFYSLSVGSQKLCDKESFSV